jgi:membrane-associated protease RseP (regulator of RpoE activity)
VLIRSLAFILIFASSFILVTGQTPDDQKKDPDKAAKSSSAMGTEKLRDIPFPAGVDLQFVIKELARELDLNVLFDTESFRGARRTSIELKNVTPAAALDYILLQEGLFFEEAGPKTVLVAGQHRQRASIPQIGVGVTPLTEQLAQYFGVDGGILINMVLDNSPGSRAGLKAGDVIVEIDGVAVKGSLALVRAINEKNESAVTLKIVRDRKGQTISLIPQKGIKSVL